MANQETTVGQAWKTDCIPTETLNQALSRIKERISQIADEISQLQRNMAMAKEEERLLERLLAIRSGGNPSQMTATPELQNNPSTGLKERYGGDSKPPIVAEVLRVLEDAGHPLHISELMRVLRERAITIPGAGTQANLIVHMSRDPQILRPSRGMYALSTWGLVPEIKSARRKTRRRKKGVKFHDRRDPK